MTGRLRAATTIVLLVVSALVRVADGQPQRYESPTRDPASGADFIAITRLDGSSAVTNTIQNRALMPLMVSWPDGGFECIGNRQIPAGSSLDGSNSGTTLRQPTLVDSGLHYGGNLQYPGSAKVFIEPKASTPPAGPGVVKSVFTQRNPDNRSALQFQAESTLSAPSGPATLTLSVPPGSQLALPATFAAYLRADVTLPTQNWQVGDVVDMTRTSFSDPAYARAAAAWFQMNGASGSQVVLVAPPTSTSSLPLRTLAVRLPGGSFHLERVYVGAVDRNGFFGAAVPLFLPGAGR